MNIFFLSRNIRKCAEYHCDKHIVKMILESTQILCSVLWSKGMDAPYKQTHSKHPSVLWSSDSIGNWIYLWLLCGALNDEFKYRFKNQNINYFNPTSIERHDNLKESDLIIDAKKNYFDDTYIGENFIEKISIQEMLLLDRSHEIMSHFDNNSINNHKSFDIALNLIKDLYSSEEKFLNFISKFSKVEFYDPPQTMDDYCKKDNPIDGYRYFYIKEKYKFAKWTSREVPEWFIME